MLETFIRHKNAVLEDDDAPTRPEEIKWREADGAGKLDLLIDIDFRMASTGLYSISCSQRLHGMKKKTCLPLTCIHIYMYSKQLLMVHGKLNPIGIHSVPLQKQSRVAKESGFYRI